MQKESEIILQTNSLSAKNTNCLKGLCAICVLLHHLYQHSGIFRDGYLRYIGAGFQALGLFMVAIFFFLSGYGLYCSNRKNKSIDGFVKRKIIPFYLIIIVYTVVYLLYSLINGSSIEWVTILKSLTFGGTIIANGWYLQVQLLYYILFFFVMKYIPQKYQITTMILLHIIYVGICNLFGLSSLFYERTFIFVMGMIWAKYKDKIDEYLSDRKMYIIVLTISFVSFVGFYVFSYVGLQVLLRSLSYFPFISFITLLMKKIQINCFITNFWGKISLEIYIIQGIFLSMFHNGVFNISNPYLYVAVVFICTIVTATILHPITKEIYALARKNENTL